MFRNLSKTHNKPPFYLGLYWVSLIQAILETNQFFQEVCHTTVNFFTKYLAAITGRKKQLKNIKLQIYNTLTCNMSNINSLPSILCLCYCFYSKHTCDIQENKHLLKIFFLLAEILQKVLIFVVSGSPVKLY